MIKGHHGFFEVIPEYTGFATDLLHFHKSCGRILVAILFTFSITWGK